MDALDSSKAYAAIDLLDCFLSCLAVAPELSATRGAQRAISIQALQMLHRARAEPGPILSAPAFGAHPGPCLAALGLLDPTPFETDDSHRLWTTLSQTLEAIEPMALARRERPMPRSLDLAWGLLEAASIFESCSDGASSSGSSSWL